jgi:hypothetical protein
MKLLFTIVLFVVSYARVSAQYNDSVNFYTGLVSNGTINKTATSRAYVLTNIVKFGMRKKNFAFNANNSWLYGEQQKRLTNNDFNSLVDFNVYRTNSRFYYWGLGNYTTNFSLKINNQYQTGLGAAYNIIDEKNAFFNVSNGILYEYSNLKVNDSTNDTYNTYRNSFRVSLRFTLHDFVSLNAMGFYQQSFNKADDYILKSTAGVNIKIVKWLSLSTTFSYNRINRTNRENLLFNYGLSVDKYF